MANFLSTINVVDNGGGNYTLYYNILLPGRNYSEAEVNLTQIEDYNILTGAIPGVQVEIKFADNGAGTPLTLSGSVEIDTPYVLTSLLPFVDVNYKAWDNAMQEYKDKGGIISRVIVG